MKPDSNRFDLSLLRNAMLRLPDAAGVNIVCRDGAVWITLEGDQRDFVLQAGDRFASTEHRHAVIQAMAPSFISLCAVPTPAQHDRTAQRRGLVFEQVLA